ncbi:MAG: flavoprotein [Micromonosporaceae bacterium]|nr:flavoprotein [Micromonosporaceae bacterium]
MTATPTKTLSIIVCGAGPARDVGALVALAQAAGWRAYLTATPAGLPFLDCPALEQQTGYPVRHAHRAPGEPRRSRPHADAVIVAPATANTICKLAAGIADTYALDILSECVGAGVPVIVLPFINTALAARRPLRLAVEDLRAEGIQVLLGTGGFEPHQPGSGDEQITAFGWGPALDVAEQVYATTHPESRTSTR